MSRFISEALGTDDPKFKHSLMGLERRSGHPNHDIRLSSQILQSVPQKIKELGLDPDDTTAEELYYALNHKLEEQDVRLVKKLRTLAAQSVNAEANLVDGVMSLVKSLNLEDSNCFALKYSVLKQQLKQTPPKKVMKALNYRSIDSMLKLEPVALLLLAVNNFESESYVSSLYAKYKKYSATSFESRKLSVISTKDKKWLPILEELQKRTGLTMASSYELATIVVLPITNEPAVGHSTVLVTNLLSEVSLVHCVSSFLKLHQVNADFGVKLLQIVEHEPYLEKDFLDHKVSFKTAQQVLIGQDSSAFAPHISSEDLAPTNLLSKLSDILDDFKFWEDSDVLALVKSAKATSLNIMDVASNVANDLPFSERTLDHFRHNLIQELAKLYTSPETSY
ncbi:MAG: hypothetical protein WDN66_04820 [Candidatus Saccharibacteria bacterium]